MVVIIYCYIGYKDKAITWHLNGFPDGNSIGSTVYCCWYFLLEVVCSVKLRCSLLQYAVIVQSLWEQKSWSEHKNSLISVLFIAFLCPWQNCPDTQKVASPRRYYTQPDSPLYCCKILYPRSVCCHGRSTAAVECTRYVLCYVQLPGTVSHIS